MRIAPRIVVLAVALSSWAWTSCASPAVAFADDSPPDTARAAEIKRRGDAAMDNGNPSDALAAYVEAYAISKEPALLYNKGRALQALGDFPRAIRELEAFEREAPTELKQRVPGLARMIAELKARVTTVSIACDKTRARITLRDRQVGECPLAEPLVVVSGRARLEVTADGFFPYSEEVDLPPGGRASVDVRLRSRATAGVLVVRSPVPNASVTIDGDRSGMAPTEAFVAPGEHAIEVRREGYHPATARAVIAAGERREIDVPLDADGGLATRWWFWTGLGVVVAGGVALAVALNVEKSPEPGSVPPGVITGGLTASGFRF